jgi:hypothetical protein
MTKNRWLIVAITLAIIFSWLLVAILRSSRTPPGAMKGDEPATPTYVF